MELFKLIGKIAIDMGDSEKTLDSISEKAQNTKSKMESLGEGLTASGKTMTKTGTIMTAGITAPIMMLGKKAIDTAASFESAMSEVGAISGATGDDLVALRNKAEEMGKTTKFSASESAEALKYMAMAGWKTSDMLDGLEGIMNLAAASGEDLGTTSDIVTDALSAFGMQAKESGQFADILAVAASSSNTNVGMMGETFKYVAPVAGALGYTAEDAALAIGIMANSGIKASQAGTTLRSIMTRLATDAGASSDSLGALGILTEKLGVEFYDADGYARPFTWVLEDMRAAWKGLTVEEQNNYAKKIAGQEAISGFLALMNAEQDTWWDLSVAIENCGGTARQMADTMNDNLNGQLTLLKSQLEGLAIQFVTLIMPYLKQGVEWLSKVCDWIAGLDDGTKKMIITVAAVLAAAGPVLIFLGNVATGVGSIISVGSKLVGGIGGLIGKVSGAGGLIPALAAIPAPVWIIIAVIGAAIAIGVLLYKNWDEIKEWAGRIWENIKNTVGGAVDAIKGFFGGIIDFVKDNWQGLALLLVNPFVGGFKLLYDNCESFRNFIDNFLNNLKEGFHNFTSNISEKAGELKDKVVDKARELKDGAVEKFNELKENATEKIETLKENAAEKFNELKERAAEKVENLKTNAIEKFNELKDNATEKVSALKENAVSRFNELKDGAVNKINDLREKGVAGFEALRAKGLEKFDSLKSGISEKLDNVKNFVSNTVQKLKDFFNFDWSLPKIKLPHFSMEGSFSLNPPSIPHIGVEWYKKAMDAPVIMDKPTAFGINPSGQIMAGGEAGSEVVSGTQTLMNMISAAVADNNDQLYEVMTRLYDLLAEYLPTFANMQVVLESGVLVGEIAQPMNEELGRITHMRGRRN